MKILITGASRGIGKALAKAFTGSGHSVLLLSRNRLALKNVAADCNRDAGEELAQAMPFDLSELDNLEQEFISLLRSRTERVDALLNNAGQLIRKPFIKTDPLEARKMFETNFFGPAQLIRILLPFMSLSNLKHMVNITSMGGYQGSAKFGGLSFYSASKAALGNLTECLAEELKDEGIRINALAIGSVQTEMLAEAFPGYQAPVKPEQMAEFIKWFTLEGCRFFNGKVLPVSVSTP